MDYILQANKKMQTIIFNLRNDVQLTGKQNVTVSTGHSFKRLLKATDVKKELPAIDHLKCEIHPCHQCGRQENIRRI